MSDESSRPQPSLTPDALQEWNQCVEKILRGVGHSLNNRASALSAVIELASDPDDDVASTASILNTELERVRAIAAAIRTVGFPRGGVEAFAPTDAVNEALEVLKLHPDAAAHTFLPDGAPSAAPPTRVERWMFVRALIALGARAAEAADGAATLRVSLRGEEDWVVARMDAGGCTPARPSPYVSELAAAMGGAPLADGYGFRVPALAALRRREAL